MTRRQAANDLIFPRQGSEPTPSSGRTNAPIAARFDPPHEMRLADTASNSIPAEPNPLAAAVSDILPPLESDFRSESRQTFRSADLPAELREELSRQASELAERLRNEAGSVDRREAQLHARQAELEQQTRSAMLWLTEQQAEFEERAQKLEARERAIAEREANLQSAERFLDAARRETERRLGELTIDSGHQTGGPTAAGSLRGSSNSPGEWIQIERSWSELRLRQDRLAELERRLDERDILLETQRVQLIARTKDLRSTIARQRDEIRRQATAVKRSLARRVQAIDERRRGLERLHAQVKSRHREALRIRLATERLCTEAMGPEGAALLQRAAAEARAQLAERDRREVAALQRKAASLEKAGRELREQRAQLARQQEDLTRWYQSRLAELAARGDLSADGIATRLESRAERSA